MYTHRTMLNQTDRHTHMLKGLSVSPSLTGVIPMCHQRTRVPVPSSSPLAVLSVPHISPRRQPPAVSHTVSSHQGHSSTLPLILPLSLCLSVCLSLPFSLFCSSSLFFIPLSLFSPHFQPFCLSHLLVLSSSRLSHALFVLHLSQALSVSLPLSLSLPVALSFSVSLFFSLPPSSVWLEGGSSVSWAAAGAMRKVISLLGNEMTL